MCPVVGCGRGREFTTKAAGVMEAELTAAGIPHDLKVSAPIDGQESALI